MLRHLQGGLSKMPAEQAGLHHCRFDAWAFALFSYSLPRQCKSKKAAALHASPPQTLTHHGYIST